MNDIATLNWDSLLIHIMMLEIDQGLPLQEQYLAPLPPRLPFGNDEVSWCPFGL
jgi:hypothetical protein